MAEEVEYVVFYSLSRFEDSCQIALLQDEDAAVDSEQLAGYGLYRIWTRSR